MQENFSARGAVWTFVVFLLGQFVIGFLAGMVIGVMGREAPAWLLPSGILAGIVVGGLCALSYVRRAYGGALGDRGREHMGLVRAPGSWIAKGAAIGIVMAVLLLLTALHVAPAQEGEGGPMSQMASGPTIVFWIWAAMAILVAPPVEEFVFRGAMLHGFKQHMTTEAAVAIVTIVFTGLHFFEIQHYWPAAVAIAVLGTAAALLRLRTGSLWPPMALHFAYNTTIVVIALVF